MTVRRIVLVLLFLSLSFTFAFADNDSVHWIKGSSLYPLGDSSNPTFLYTASSGVAYSFASDDYISYTFFTSNLDGSDVYPLFVSLTPFTLYRYADGVLYSTLYSSSYVSDGTVYYYLYGRTQTDNPVSVIYGSDVNSVLSYLLSPEHVSVSLSILPTLSKLVFSASALLSGLALSVVQTPLLLAFVIFCFVGVSCGLLIRFIRR